MRGRRRISLLERHLSPRQTLATFDIFSLFGFNLRGSYSGVFGLKSHPSPDLSPCSGGWTARQQNAAWGGRIRELSQGQAAVALGRRLAWVPGAWEPKALSTPGPKPQKKPQKPRSSQVPSVRYAAHLRQSQGWATYRVCCRARSLQEA